jgi:DNA-directed RNA polymerase subunit E'/Rpb7
MTTRNKYPQFVREGEAPHLAVKGTNENNIYSKALIHKKVVLKIVNIGTNIKHILEKAVALQIEGKCIIEGYVKPNSVSVLTYSSGIISAADIVFEVVFECLVCSPVEGMVIQCVAKNITKAGIRAETNEPSSPVVVFIARDHHYKSEEFANVKENDTIHAKVIGQRYELNDKYVSVIAVLLNIATRAPVVSNVPELRITPEEIRVPTASVQIVAPTLPSAAPTSLPAATTVFESNAPMTLTTLKKKRAPVNATKKKLTIIGE